MPDLDHIEVRGARENNLRDVSVDIPKRAITVFTGVSGSGKSYRLRDATIADVLEMSVEEAAGFFTEKAVSPMLAALGDVRRAAARARRRGGLGDRAAPRGALGGGVARNPESARRRPHVPADRGGILAPCGWARSPAG
jgi:energy-coupling factor transporter ATP-binding protein EcfA2